MLGVLIQNLKFLRDAFFSSDSARQLAAGVTLGLFLGLIPKGNLISVGLSLALFGTMVNLGAGMITAIAVSLIAQFTDPFAHEIGAQVLTQQHLAVLWQWLASLPVIPWTRFNNTVVMGNLIIGCLLAVPTYRLSWRWFDRKIREAKLAEELNKTLNESSPDDQSDSEVVTSSDSDEVDRELAAEDAPVTLPPSKPTQLPDQEKVLVASDHKGVAATDSQTEVEAATTDAEELGQGQAEPEVQQELHPAMADSSQPTDESEEDQPAIEPVAQPPAGVRLGDSHAPPAPKAKPRRRKKVTTDDGGLATHTDTTSGWREATATPARKPLERGSLSIPSFDVLSTDQQDRSNEAEQ